MVTRNKTTKNACSSAVHQKYTVVLGKNQNEKANNSWHEQF